MCWHLFPIDYCNFGHVTTTSLLQRLTTQWLVLNIIYNTTGINDTHTQCHTQRNTHTSGSHHIPQIVDILQIITHRLTLLHQDHVLITFSLLLISEQLDWLPPDVLTHTHILSHTHSHTLTHTHTHSHTHTHTLSLSHTHTLSLSHTHTHTHTLSLTHTHTHTHTYVGFCGLWGLSIGVMVFILNNLYVLLPYTYPTPKLSPHRRLCASLDFQKNTI